MTQIMKVVKLSEYNRELFQLLVPAPIPDDATALLLTKDGYTTTNTDSDPSAGIRVPHQLIVTYYDIPLED